MNINQIEREWIKADCYGKKCKRYSGQVFDFHLLYN